MKTLGETIITKEFEDLKLIKPEHILFKSADEKEDLDGIIYKPADFNENKKYPLILSVYGGPASKRVANYFSMNDFLQTLSQLGFIVLIIDHRGVSRRGKVFETLMYMKLGQIELEDHIKAVEFITSRPYVDKNKIGIFGSSYGGYLTCMALLKHPEIFHVGVAGAPCADLRNYDTIYTERYMRKPEDNAEGYNLASCLKYAENLKGHLFINHGTVDDNVHFGNTVQLVNELLKYNKKFDLMIYPGRRHLINPERFRESLVEYFVEHLLNKN
jgi:dipeptidyl-peptidase-4